MPDRAVKAWAPKRPDGRLLVEFTQPWRVSARNQLTESFYGRAKWKQLYRRGWRVVPVIVKEVP